MADTQPDFDPSKSFHYVNDWADENKKAAEDWQEDTQGVASTNDFYNSLTNGTLNQRVLGTLGNLGSLLGYAPAVIHQGANAIDAEIPDFIKNSLGAGGHQLRPLESAFEAMNVAAPEMVGIQGITKLPTLAEETNAGMSGIQQALRAGDKDAVINILGKDRINDQVSKQIDNAINYYKQGGKEDTRVVAPHPANDTVDKLPEGAAAAPPVDATVPDTTIREGWEPPANDYGYAEQPVQQQQAYTGGREEGGVWKNAPLGTATPDEYLGKFATKSTVKDYLAGLGGDNSQTHAVIAPDGTIHSLNIGQLGHADEVGHSDFGFAVGDDVAQHYVDIHSYRDSIGVRNAVDQTEAQTKTLNQLKARSRSREIVEDQKSRFNGDPQMGTPSIPRQEEQPSLLDQLSSLIDEGQSRVTKQGELNKAGRSKQLSAAEEAMSGLSGEERMRAGFRAMSGEFEKATADPAFGISQESRDALIDHVLDHPAFVDDPHHYNALNAARALGDLMDGKSVQPARLEQLKRVLPDEFIDQLQKGKDVLADAAERKASGQGELFRGNEVLSAAPEGTPGLGPEEVAKPEQTYFPNSKQGDLFVKSEPKPVKPLGFGKEEQAEMFPTGQVLSKGDIRMPEEPIEAKPEKFTIPKGQGDLFPDEAHPPTKLPDKPKELGEPESALASALNVPKAVMASMDLSAPLRQGLPLIHRGEWWKSFKDMFGKAWSEDTFNASEAEIKGRASYPLMEKSGLSLTDTHGPLSRREESFMTNLPGKVPMLGRVYKGSERAYTGFLNQLRADTFDSLVNDLKKSGGYSEDDLKGVANYINTFTGRGDLGKKLNPHAPLLNSIFFAPRFVASRVQMFNPATYTQLPKAARLDAIKSLSAYGGVILAANGLAYAAGAGTTTDPRSSDFGKIKVGNTRYDLGAGMLQLATLAARLATNEKTTANGTKELGKGYKADTRADVIKNFARSKMAPLPGALWNYFDGKNYVGEPVTLSSQLKSLFIPMIFNDLHDAIADQGAVTPKSVAVGAAKVAPSVFGVGVSTYDTSKKPTKASAPAPTPKAINDDQPDFDPSKGLSYVDEQPEFDPSKGYSYVKSK